MSELFSWFSAYFPSFGGLFRLIGALNPLIPVCGGPLMTDFRLIFPIKLSHRVGTIREPLKVYFSSKQLFFGCFSLFFVLFVDFYLLFTILGVEVSNSLSFDLFLRKESFIGETPNPPHIILLRRAFFIYERELYWGSAPSPR